MTQWASPSNKSYRQTSKQSVIMRSIVADRAIVTTREERQRFMLFATRRSLLYRREKDPN